METNIHQILCDNCKMELFYKSEERTNDRGFLMKVENNHYCSLLCFSIHFWKPKAGITDLELVENLKRIMPDWKIEPPDYREKYNQKKLEEVKEAMKGLSGYELKKLI